MLRFFILFLWVWLPGTSAPAQKAQYHAVIVGVSDYEDPIHNLNFADDDAMAYGDFMLRAGIPPQNISLLINRSATRANILEALRASGSKIKEGDRFYFYFSGHGGEGFLVPHDNRHLLDHADLKAAIASLHAEVKFCVIDACRSASFRTKNMEQTPQDDLTKTYARFTQKASKNLVLFASSRAEESSEEHSRLRGGLFTYHLLQGLQGQADLNSDGSISLGELYQFVSRSVKANAMEQQNPVMVGKFNPGYPIIRAARRH